MEEQGSQKIKLVGSFHGFRELMVDGAHLEIVAPPWSEAEKDLTFRKSWMTQVTDKTACEASVHIQHWKNINF